MKHYLSRSQSRFWSADMPVGDPHGGAAYGEFNDPVSAIVGGGLGLIGSVISGNAAQDAANTQAQAANNASQAQLQMFNTINEQQKPYRQAGQNALAAILGGYNLGPTSGGIDAGQFSHQFNANDLNSNLAPNYQFMLDQGMSANKNLANSTGGLLSGNTLQGLNTFAQNYAGNAYQNAFNNYQAQQGNIFNRLSTIAGLGNSSNQTTAQAGTTTAANVGNAMMSGGAAQAAGTVGAANAISGGIGNIGGYYMLNNLMNGNAASAANQWATGYGPATSAISSGPLWGT